MRVRKVMMWFSLVVLHRVCTGLLESSVPPAMVIAASIFDRIGPALDALMRVDRSTLAVSK